MDYILPAKLQAKAIKALRGQYTQYITDIENQMCEAAEIGKVSITCSKIEPDIAEHLRRYFGFMGYGCWIQRNGDIVIAWDTYNDAPFYF